MPNTTDFLNKYRELETAAIAKYNFERDGRAVTNLMNMRQFAAYKADLSYCKEIRNLLTHNKKIGDEYAVEPSKSAFDLLDKLITIINNPPLCSTIAIHTRSLYYKSLNDYVLPTLLDMDKKNFSHVPILKDKKLLGVFSDNCIFSALLSTGKVSVDSNTKFSDFSDFLPIDKHLSEEFKFAKYNSMICEIEDLFEASKKNKHRLGMVFLTKSGNPNEDILGVITPWNIIGQY